MATEVLKYTGDFKDVPQLAIVQGDIVTPLHTITEHLVGWDVYVGYEDGVAKGFFILSQANNPQRLSPLSTAPYVAHLSNEGSADLFRALQLGIKAAVQALGAPAFFAANFSDVSDDVMIRAYQYMGVGTTLVSFLVFDVVDA